MKRYILISCALLAYLFLPQLEALNRDYHFDCEEDKTYQNYYQPYCFDHAPGNFLEDIDSDLLYLIPENGPECKDCCDESIYLGYIDIDFRKYIFL